MALVGYLRQSTAVSLVVGPFVNISNGNTEVTSAVSRTDVLLSKNWAPFAAKANTSATVHLTQGMHGCPLNSGDVNALGQLTLGVHATDTVALHVRHDYAVLPASLFDAWFGTSYQQVAIASYNTALTPLQPTVAGRTLDVTTGGEAGVDWANIGSPTTVVNLTGTRISAAESVSSVSTVSSVTGTVNLTMTQTVSATPTAGTVENALTRAGIALPLASAGSTAGLATYGNLFAATAVGFVSDAAPLASNFEGNNALNSTISGIYTGQFLVFPEGTTLHPNARKITSYAATGRVFYFSAASAGSAADREFPFAPTNGESFLIIGLHGA